MTLTLFIIYALASYRVTRFFVEDTLFDAPRDAIWSRFPPSTPIGYLFTCYWCMGFWVASLFWLGSTIVSAIATPVAVIFAMSAVVGIVATYQDRG